MISSCFVFAFALPLEFFSKELIIKLMSLLLRNQPSLSLLQTCVYICKNHQSHLRLMDVQTYSKPCTKKRKLYAHYKWDISLNEDTRLKKKVLQIRWSALWYGSIGQNTSQNLGRFWCLLAGFCRFRKQEAPKKNGKKLMTTDELILKDKAHRKILSLAAV